MKTPTQSHAPGKKVLSCVNLSALEAEIEANQFLKGRCLKCGEVFNLRVPTPANDRGWQERDFCPDCGEIFEEEKN